MTKKTVMVVALSQGFYEHLREVGDRFQITYDDAEEGAGLGKWMREVDKDGSIVQTKDEKKGITAAPIVPSAPFTPGAEVYKVKHVAGGNYVVLDAKGTPVGVPFPKVKGDPAAAKIAAQQAADSMNKTDGVTGATLSPQQAAQVQTQTALSQDTALNADVDDDNHPDA